MLGRFRMPPYVQAALCVSVLVAIPLALADGDVAHEYTPIGESMLLQKTTVPLHVSPDNSLVWGYVRGTIANPALDYPVIIQMFQGDRPVHFAQVGVRDDGSYEYRFRVLDITNGTTTRIFEGDYQVVIFKVVREQTAPATGLETT